jgi:hypothetical protein
VISRLYDALNGLCLRFYELPPTAQAKLALILAVVVLALVIVGHRLGIIPVGSDGGHFVR